MVRFVPSRAIRRRDAHSNYVQVGNSRRGLGAFRPFAPAPAASALSLIIFRIVLLIVARATAAAWVLILLLGKLAAPSLLTPPIGLIALLFGVVYAATLSAALLLALGLRHRVFLIFGQATDNNPGCRGTFRGSSGYVALFPAE
jgi:hypothetical protein